MDIGRNAHRHLAGLDLIRFWAASSVCLFHLAFWSWVSPTDLPARAAAGSVRLEALAPFSWFGRTAVETFFVLSGVVICMSAEKASPYAFLRGRVTRLYPAVWFCATATAAVALMLDLAPPSTIATAYLASLTLFPTGPWVDTVYHTLVPECVFYALVFALLLLRCFRYTSLVAACLGFYSLAYWVFGALWPKLIGHGILHSFSKNALFFALGMMIVMIERNRRSVWHIACGSLFALCGAVEVHLVSLGTIDFARQAGGVDLAGYAPLGVIVWLASVAAIVLSLFTKACPRSPRTCFALRTLGLMTYPLYLLHDVVGAAVLRTSASPEAAVRSSLRSPRRLPAPTPSCDWSRCFAGPLPRRWMAASSSFATPSIPALCIAADHVRGKYCPPATASPPTPPSSAPSACARSGRDRPS